MKYKSKKSYGYTMIELMLVISIMATLASIIMPRVDLVFQKAHQSKTKSNLGSIRSALSIYYSETEGGPALASYPEGDSHYTTDGLDLTNVLVPRYLPMLPTPKLVDRMETFNGLSQSFDIASEALMAMSPPKDVYILWGPPDYTPMLSSPYVYDNHAGIIYIPNGNLDTNNGYFYNW